MGQQQLLLLVLGIVIVGVAVVIGIQVFSQSQKKTNADAIVNDIMRIASDTQAWKLKPTAFGGGVSEVQWKGLTFDQMGYETGDQSYSSAIAAATEYENSNAIYALSNQVEGPLTITAISYETDGLTLLNIVVVTVAGTQPSDITTTVN